MPKTLPIQTSFSYGEISPHLHGQIDSDGYKKGSKVQTNFISHPQGPCSLRAGFRYLASDTDALQRIITLPGSAYDHILAFTATELLAWYYVDGVAYSQTVSYNVAYLHTTAGELPLLRYCLHPEKESIVVFSRYRDPVEIEYNSSVPRIQYGVMSFTARPSDWGSTSGEYPQCGTFHRGRLYVSSCTPHPSRIWASKAGDYDNFTMGAADDDAMDFHLSNQGNIVWMESVSDLVVGSDRHETLVKSEGGVITPSDVYDQAQSTHGSCYIQPVNLGNSILYVGPSQQRLYEMSYSWESEKWLSKELTFSARHMFSILKPINSVSYTGEPYNLICICRNDGSMVMANYDKDLNSIGWHYHTTNGTVKAVGSIKDTGNGLNRPVMIVLRPSSKHAIEVYDGTILGHPVHLDSWIEYSATGTALTGLANYYASSTVSVIVDPRGTPYYLGDVAIDGSGDGTLPTPITGLIALGYSYDGILTLLPRYKILPIGANVVALKKYAKVFLDLYDSLIPYVNGELAVSDEYGVNPAVPRTGLVKAPQVGWDRTAEITITHNTPEKLTILGVYAEMVEEVHE